MRTTLVDRPGALARLATRCGSEGVNILGLQIFPGMEAVTDELVLNAPHDWGMADVAAMVERAGGRDVSVAHCTAHALVDGVTRYLRAVRCVVDDPATLARVLDDVLDGEAGGHELDPVLAALEVTVGHETVTVRRAAYFTATEEARADAFADVVTELLATEAPRSVSEVPSSKTDPAFRLATTDDALALGRMIGRCSAVTLAGHFGVPLAAVPPRMARRLLAAGPVLVVDVGSEIVGMATLTDDQRAEVSVLVEDGWQGRGLGARLLQLSSRLAKSRGAAELVLHSRHNPGAAPRLAAAAGLCGRVRKVGDEFVLTVSLRRVAPLLEAVEGPVGSRPLDPAPA